MPASNSRLPGTGPTPAPAIAAGGVGCAAASAVLDEDEDDFFLSLPSLAFSLSFVVPLADFFFFASDIWRRNLNDPTTIYDLHTISDLDPDQPFLPSLSAA
jgi:hypothetical protein